MIGFLKGKVILKDAVTLIIEVNGVGYSVLASKPVLEQAILDQEIQVFTYTHVREDALELFAFVAFADLKLFEQLLSVSGIGPKTALGIFAIGSREQIVQAILKAEVDFFVAVPRLGRKNAQKIIIDLKNKIGSQAELDLLDNGANSEKDEVAMALKSFGFSSREVLTALKTIDPKTKNVSETIRLALKYLGK